MDTKRKANKSKNNQMRKLLLSKENRIKKAAHGRGLPPALILRLSANLPGGGTAKSLDASVGFPEFCSMLRKQHVKEINEERTRRKSNTKARKRIREMTAKRKTKAAKKEIMVINGGLQHSSFWSTRT